MRSGSGDGGQQGNREQLDESPAGTNGEGAMKRREVQAVCRRPQDFLRVAAERMDAPAQLLGIGRGDQGAAGLDQQWVARHPAQPCQRPAHRGGAYAKPAGSPRHAALGEQRVQRQEKVQVDAVHRHRLARRPADAQRRTQSIISSCASGAQEPGRSYRERMSSTKAPIPCRSLPRPLPPPIIPAAPSCSSARHAVSAMPWRPNS